MAVARRGTTREVGRSRELARNAATATIKTGQQLMAAADALHPSLTLLVKLGSIAVHADEATAPGAHRFDIVAIRQLIDDPEVATWLAQMDASAFLPKKRSNRS